MTTNPPEPLTVTLTIGLDTPISDRYVQTGEDLWSSQPVTVLDAVIERAAQILANGVSVSNKELHRDLRDRALRRIDDVVTSTVEPIVVAALDGTVQQTNAYGEPTGKATTLRELVIEKVQKQLTPSNNRDAFSRNNRSAIDEALTATAKSVVAKELAEALAEAKQALKDSLAQSAAETMADTITKAMARP